MILKMESHIYRNYREKTENTNKVEIIQMAPDS